MISLIGNHNNIMSTPLGEYLNSTGAGSGSSSFQEILANFKSSSQASIPDSEKNKTDFISWKEHYFTTGIFEDRRTQVEECSTSFMQIMDRAAANGGYDDPQKFINSLSTSELAVLQHIHCLADPIIPQGLSKEGALNLLYSPDQLKDIDHDGFEMCGIGKTYLFPPPDAPESFKLAWKQTTANMSEMEVMLLSGSFLPVAPFEGDESMNGVTTGFSAYIEPTTSSYRELVQKLLDKFKPPSLITCADPKMQETLQHAVEELLSRFNSNTNLA